MYERLNPKHNYTHMLLDMMTILHVDQRDFIFMIKIFIIIIIITAYILNAFLNLMISVTFKRFESFALSLTSHSQIIRHIKPLSIDSKIFLFLHTSMIMKIKTELVYKISSLIFTDLTVNIIIIQETLPVWHWFCMTDRSKYGFSPDSKEFVIKVRHTYFSGHLFEEQAPHLVLVFPVLQSLRMWLT